MPNRESEGIKKSILGSFEGECADATITNLNGLDITREVWENVFDSDEYKKAIDNGWYIGYLGHPEDPSCMDFEHACIVMTEGHIDSSGKIYGKFDLVDTPVGRIVKSFIDAGVTFGISVRGAGDIVNNSVDPETFVFRGFDLVSFPAYPDAIPVFKNIAASTDDTSRKKYQSVCAAVAENIDALNTVESIDIIQSQFAKQSHTYADLEMKKRSLSKVQSSTDIDSERVSSLVDLYIQASSELDVLKAQNKDLQNVMSATANKYRKKYNAMRRIMQAQLEDLSNDLEEVQAALDKKSEMYNVLASRYSGKCNELASVKSSIDDMKSENLKYRRKISASQTSIDEKDSVIAKLRTDVSKTVDNVSSLKLRASNLDETNKKLRRELNAVKASLKAYQDAYANIYANAVGANLDVVTISDSTSVEDLQSVILGSVNTSTEVHELDPVDIVYDDYSDEADIVTL